MGVLQAIEAEGRGNWARVGGLVGPGGTGFIGNSTDATREPLVIAIRRIVLDEKMARAAAGAGAMLVEEYTVGATEFSRADGLWTVRHRNEQKAPYRARVLVTADGALSRLARSMVLSIRRPTRFAAVTTSKPKARISMPMVWSTIHGKCCRVIAHCSAKRRG